MCIATTPTVTAGWLKVEHASSSMAARYLSNIHGRDDERLLHARDRT